MARVRNVYFYKSFRRHTSYSVDKTILSTVHHGTTYMTTLRIRCGHNKVDHQRSFILRTDILVTTVVNHIQKDNSYLIIVIIIIGDNIENKHDSSDAITIINDSS